MIGLFVLVAAGAQTAPAIAQSQPDSTRRPGEMRVQSLSIHNPYSGGNVSARLLIPARPRPLAAVVLVTGGSAREQTAAGSLARYLGGRGCAVLTMPPSAPAGPTEEDNLNTVAALHHLQTRQGLGGVPVGLVGYGSGVRLAAVSAAEGNPASFLALLGGEVVPDRLNSLPPSLARGSLPKNEAARALEHVRAPILILIGEYDRQGTHRAAVENSDALRSELETARHQNYTIKVLYDSDNLLADTGPAGSSPSSTAIPPTSVWKTTADWIVKQARSLDPTASEDTGAAVSSKPVHIYPRSAYGPFSWHPSLVWQPAIGDQPRPFGYWYW
jgi:dienelactone hydrolase